MQSQAQVMCRFGVGLNRLKDVQDQEYTSLCHGQIRTPPRVRAAELSHCLQEMLFPCYTDNRHLRCRDPVCVSQVLLLLSP